MSNTISDSSPEVVEKYSISLMNSTCNDTAAEQSIKSLREVAETVTFDILIDIASYMCTSSLLHDYQSLKTTYANCSTKSMCSNVWKNNTYIYKCQDCCVDDSCAICLQCFQPEKHIGHRYRLVPSYRGCCDCGDASAWRLEGWCDRHGQSKVSGPLPTNLTFTIELFSNTIVKIIGELIHQQQQQSNNNNNNQNDSTKLIENRQDNMTIEIIKNELSTTRSILITLVKVVNCMIDLLGDSVALTCAKSFTIPASTQIYFSLFSLLAESSPEMEPLERFVISLFVSNDFRDQLSIHLAQHYDIIRQSLETSSSRPFSLTVQLFTVDSIALKIVSTSNFIHIVNNFNNTFQSALTNDGQLNLKSNIVKDKLYFRTLVDICYILRNKSSFLWLMDNPFPLFESFKPLYWTQEMCAHTRITTSHVEHEDDTWTFAFNLEYYLRRYLLDPIHNLLISFSLEEPRKFKDIHIEALKNYFLEAIDRYYTTSNNKIIWKRGLRDHQIPEYRVNKQPVSIHLPLHRALSQFLYAGTFIFEKKPKESLYMNGELIEPSLIIDPILRLYVFISQVRAGLWVRNGTSVTYQSQLYLRNEEFCQPDFYLLQYCILSMQPSQLYAQMLDRCELATWFTMDGIIHDQSPSNSPLSSPRGGNSPSSSSFLPSILLRGVGVGSGTSSNVNAPTSRPSSPPMHVSNSDKNSLIMAEDFLALLVSLITDRSRICRFTTEEIIRRDIIHVLAIGNATHSDLAERLPENAKANLAFDQILANVSNYHVATGTEKGKYQLRDECWKEWDAYYPLYTRVELQRAEENYIRYFKQQHSRDTPYHRPLHPLRPAVPLLSGIESILHCDILHAIIFVILYNSLSSSLRSSDALLTNTLHLISIILQSSELIPLSNQSNNNSNNNSNQLNNNNSKNNNISIPKYETMDFGFKGGDFISNMFHLVKQNSFVVVGSGANPHSMFSMLRTMLASSQFEQHCGSMEKITKHPLVESHRLLCEGGSVGGQGGSVGSSGGAGGSFGSALSKSPEQSLLMKEYAKKKQLEIMKKFSDQQKAFLKKSQDSFQQNNNNSSNNNSSSPVINSVIGSGGMLMFNGDSMDEEIDDDEEEDGKNVMGYCSMCKEEMNPLKKPFGYVSYIQKNQILSKHPLVQSDSNNSQEMKQIITEIDSKELFKDINRVKSSFISFCSHMMHLDCYKTLVNSHTRPEGPSDIFHCPCCRRLSNTTIPYSLTPITVPTNNNNLLINNNNSNFIEWIQQSINQQYKFTAETVFNPTSILQEIITNQETPYKLHILWNMVISTITMMEMNQRGTNILNSITHQFKSSVQNLIKLVVSKSSRCSVDRNVEMDSFLSIIFPSTRNPKVSLLNLEMFGMMVRLYICNESAQSTYKQDSSNLIKILFISNLIQSIYLRNIKLKEFKLDKEIMGLLLPFLRRTSILLSILEYPNKNGLNRIDDFGHSNDLSNNVQMEYKALTQYLGIDSQLIHDLFNNQQILDYIEEMWINSESKVKHNGHNGSAMEMDEVEMDDMEIDKKTISPPLRQYKKFEFMHLPRDYHPFFLENNQKLCQECHNPIKRSPSLCLFCGKLMCSYSEFIDHCEGCAGGIGVFLLLADSLVVILLKNSIKIWGTLYIDQYDDEDIGLKRGKPLFLNQERLSRLRSDVLSLTLHNLPQNAIQANLHL